MSLKPQHCDFDVMWPKLQNTASKVIQMHSIPKMEWNDRIHDVYKLCIAMPEPHSERVYLETKKLLESHIQSLFWKIQNDTSEECLLSKYYKEWNVFKEGLKYLNMLYSYLNGQYIKKLKHTTPDLDFGDVEPHQQLMEINELGAYLWKVNMILPMREPLVTLLLHYVNLLRDGSSSIPNTKIIQKVIKSFISVEKYRSSKGKSQLYHEIFESDFLRATNAYYASEAKKLLENNDCSKYMEQVLERLRIERERLDLFLPKESHTRVIAECEQCMVGGYLEFLQAECRAMVEKESKKELHNMFLLLKPFESGLQALIKQIEERIKEKGLYEIKRLNPKEETFQSDFVEKILKVHNDFHQIIEEVFDGDKLFLAALDKSCTEIVNYRENNNIPCKSPEILARYFDNLLKKNSKGVCEQEIDDKLSKAINVFKYINDKDVFQKFYSKNLAKRLIYSLYLSLDSEEAMINRLKLACGYEFTTKLHRMFTDIKVSEDLNRNFVSKIEEEKLVLPFQIQLLVLQACAWPMSPPQTVSPTAPLIPPSFEKALQSFEQFYGGKFTGRKLTWMHNLCNSDMKLLFTKKTYIVTMSTYHTSVLLQFENCDDLTFEELLTRTNLPEESLNRHLQSFVDNKLFLCNGKCSEVDVAEAKPQKSANVPSYTKETIFSLNMNFSNKRMKFKLTAAPPKEIPQAAKKESDETYAWIEEDRKLFVQAAIVRIMKSRKRLNQNTLIQEVIEITKIRFAPSVVMIKKAIEALIDKQYIERVPSTTDEFQYIA